MKSAHYEKKDPLVLCKKHVLSEPMWSPARSGEPGIIKSDYVFQQAFAQERSILWLLVFMEVQTCGHCSFTNMRLSEHYLHIVWWTEVQACAGIVFRPIRARLFFPESVCADFAAWHGTLSWRKSKVLLNHMPASSKTWIKQTPSLINWFR